MDTPTFRAASGEPFDGALEIPVRCFAAPAGGLGNSAEEDDGGNITLSLAFLHEKLAIAESVNAFYNSQQGHGDDTASSGDKLPFIPSERLPDKESPPDKLSPTRKVWFRDKKKTRRKCSTRAGVR